jgi:aspartyl-tRNA(Asn)/glutamyl-tRNA(Gln) amidotransferase subunit B
MTSNGHTPVIGLECHVELGTRSKMFCSCPATFGGEPNTNVCPVCLGEPGSLPVPNKRAVEYTMMIGLALGSAIAPHSLFHRKNYFYPDMPKNYQISQYDSPLCVGGSLEVDGRRIGITRVHLEEDTGKSLHVGATGRISEATHSLVDYNRAGIPLVEVVGEPEITSATEAQRYLAELRMLLEALGVSDVRMEEGSMRCDANVSLRNADGSLGTRVEIKNLNSIRSLGRAVTYEIERQAKVLAAGERVVQETRHFDEAAGVTKTLRSKEEAFDYRYFPEPDMVPIAPDEAWIGSLRNALPELPQARRTRLVSQHGLTDEHARLVGESVESLAYFDAALKAGASPRDIAVWMTGELARWLAEAGVPIASSPVTAKALAGLIALVAGGTINLPTAKSVLEESFKTGKAPADIVAEKGLEQVSDAGAIDEIIDRVLAAHAGEVERFKGGEEKVFGFLVGAVMKETKGRANPKAVNERLRAKLSG